MGLLLFEYLTRKKVHEGFINYQKKGSQQTLDKLPMLREIRKLSLSRVELSEHPHLFVLVFSAPRLGIHLGAFAGSGPQIGATGNVESQQESQDMARDNETANRLREFLLLVGTRYVQEVNPSTTEEVNGLFQYLHKMRKLFVADIRQGSLTIIVECSSLEILHELWEDYRSGHLGKMVQTYLVTDNTLRAFGVAEIEIGTSIYEEEYTACEQYFLKLQGE